MYPGGSEYPGVESRFYVNEASATVEFVQILVGIHGEKFLMRDGDNNCLSRWQAFPCMQCQIMLPTRIFRVRNRIVRPYLRSV